MVVPLQVNMHTQAERFLTMKIYAVPDTQEEYDSLMRGHVHLLFERGCLLALFLGAMVSVTTVRLLSVRSFEGLLYSKDLIRHLNASPFDAVLRDPMYPGGAVLPIQFTATTVSLYLTCALFVEPVVGKVQAKRLEQDSRSRGNCRRASSLLVGTTAIAADPLYSLLSRVTRQTQP